MILKYLSLVVLFLAGCGGGTSFPPSVSAIKAQTLQYSKSAVIYVGGKYLSKNLVAETGSCTNPAFRSDSSTDLAVLTCNVTAVGELPVSIKSPSGELLYKSTLTVPLPQVGIATSLGNVIVELNPVVAPVTVNNFLAYVNNGYYLNTLMHRVIPGFVIQGGGYTSGLVKKTGQAAPIALESINGLSNSRGSIAMARTDLPNSATSEFFINLVDNSSQLDYQNDSKPGYAVFGKVIQGLSVVDAIASVPTTTVTTFANVPVTDVVINLMLQTQ